MKTGRSPGYCCCYPQPRTGGGGDGVAAAAGTVAAAVSLPAAAAGLVPEGQREGEAPLGCGCCVVTRTP